MPCLSLSLSDGTTWATAPVPGLHAPASTFLPSPAWRGGATAAVATAPPQAVRRRFPPSPFPALRQRRRTSALVGPAITVAAASGLSSLDPNPRSNVGSARSILRSGHHFRCPSVRCYLAAVTQLCWLGLGTVRSRLCDLESVLAVVLPSPSPSLPPQVVELRPAHTQWLPPHCRWPWWSTVMPSS